MSLILFEFCKTVNETSFEDGNNYKFSWDKKTYDDLFFDIRDFLNFFKIKSFNEISLLFKNEYTLYKKEETALLNWGKTFDCIPNLEKYDFEMFPEVLIERYTSSFSDILFLLMDRFKKERTYNDFCSYYRDNLDSFWTVKNFSPTIKTGIGDKKIQLDFAENFRYKSINNSINIFSIPKKNRDIIIPQEEEQFLYVVDFRQFEFRTFLMLSGSAIDYESENIYEDLGKVLGLTDPKIGLISYLYSERLDDKFENIICKNSFIEKIQDDMFKWREFSVFLASEFKFNKKIHTIIQTVSYFIYLKKFSKIIELFEGKESKIIFPLHDSIIFSISPKEIDLIDDISEILNDEIYKTKQYIGKNFAEMELI